MLVVLELEDVGLEFPRANLTWTLNHLPCCGLIHGVHSGKTSEARFLRVPAGSKSSNPKEKNEGSEVICQSFSARNMTSYRFRIWAFGFRV